MNEEELLPLSSPDSFESRQEPIAAPQQSSNRASLTTTPEGCSEANSNPDLNGGKAASLVGDNERSQAISAKYVAYLGCIKDNWSSCHAAKLLDEELISYLRPRFVLLSTPLKVRVLTSLLYIKADLVCSHNTNSMPADTPVLWERGPKVHA